MPWWSFLSISYENLSCDILFIRFRIFICIMYLINTIPLFEFFLKNWVFCIGSIKRQLSYTIYKEKMLYFDRCLYLIYLEIIFVLPIKIENKNWIITQNGTSYEIECIINAIFLHKKYYVLSILEDFNYNP